jgi:hypothetical protein
VAGRRHLEDGALRDHHEPGRRRGQHLHDAIGHGLVEDAHRPRPLQHPPDDRRAILVEEVLVHIGPRDRHQQRDARPPRQPHRGRSAAEGMERVDDRGRVLADLVLDRSLWHHREIPDAHLDAALPETARDAIDRDGIPTDRRRREGREDGHPSCHGCEEPTPAPRDKAIDARHRAGKDGLAPGRPCVKVSLQGDRLIGEGEQMEGASREIGCPECVELLADYIDGSLPQDQIAQLEWHLDGCPPCVAFVNTYKGTVNAARRLREHPETHLPAELRQKLIAFLKRSDASKS